MGHHLDAKLLALLCYVFATFVLLLSFGGVLIHTGNQIEMLSTQGTAYIKQIAQDWDTQPFIDVTVTADTYCPVNTTEIYEHVWYGHDRGCDCIGVCGYYMDGCY